MRAGGHVTHETWSFFRLRDRPQGPVTQDLDSTTYAITPKTHGVSPSRTVILNRYNLVINS